MKINSKIGMCIYFIKSYNKQTEMFDFLQKLSHQHPEKSKPQQKEQIQQIQDSRQFQINEPPKLKQDKKKENVGYKQQQVKKQTKQKKKLASLSAQLQMGQNAELDPQVLKILQRVRDQSETRLAQNLLQVVNEERAKVERKVYLREMSDNFQEYLEEILLQSSSPNRFVRYGLAEMIDHVANSIYDDIRYVGKYEVVKKTGMTKDELALLQKSISQIRNNEGSIRQKVGELKLQLKNQSQKINDRSLQIISKHSYSINHPKTKQVQAFLKSIQMERMQQKMRYEQNLQKQKERKQRQQYFMEVAREKAKSQRHQRLVEAFEIKRKVKQQEINIAAKKNQEFKQWAKAYKKVVPLFKEKQKQFVEKFVLPEHEEKYQKLLRRRQNFLPMEFDQIQDHEERYMDTKKDNYIRHKAELRMQKQAEKQRQKHLDSLHKGKYRYYVLEEMVAKQEARDPKEDIIEKKIKQLAYSQNVKESHKPKIDPVKKSEMQMLLNSSSKRKRKYRNPNRVESTSLIQPGAHYRSYSYGEQEQQERDPRKQGERNRRYFKQYIRDKIEKGQIRQKQQRPVTIEPKQNYLEELRKQRQKQGLHRKAETIDSQIQSIKRKQDVSALLAKVQHHDQRASRLQSKLRYSAHKPEQEQTLENDYLYSIKAKLELMRNYD